VVDNNAYFEQQRAQYFQTLSDDDLVLKISECHQIIGDIKATPAWKALTKDILEKERFIDNNWHLVSDEKILNNMRVKKNALRVVLDLKKEYEAELEYAVQQLETRKNTSTSIPKDYDVEGNVEE